MLELLSDYTLRNAAIGAAILGVVAGVLGCFALLRRQSLIGDTLSHAALPGICLGFLWSGSRALEPLLAGALISGGLAGGLVLVLTRFTRLKTDAALGIALSLFFALGIVLLTLIQGQAGAAQAGLESFLFGQAAAMLPRDLWVMGSVGAVALLLIAALWKELKLASFDAQFARTTGLPVLALELVLTLLVAVAVVVGLQMVGVVLMAAMVIAPAAAARQWARSLEQMVVMAAGVGAVSGITGAVISAASPGLATGPLVVLTASAATAISLAFAPGRGLVWQALSRRAERRALPNRQVLATLARLCEDHGDPDYPAEAGMLDAYHGAKTARALAELSADGLIAPVSHMESEGVHWVLTAEGRAEAAALRGPMWGQDA